MASTHCASLSWEGGCLPWMGVHTLDWGTYLGWNTYLGRYPLPCQLEGRYRPVNRQTFPSINITWVKSPNSQQTCKQRSKIEVLLNITKGAMSGISRLSGVSMLYVPSLSWTARHDCGLYIDHICTFNECFMRS